MFHIENHIEQTFNTKPCDSHLNRCKFAMLLKLLLKLLLINSLFVNQQLKSLLVIINIVI